MDTMMFGSGIINSIKPFCKRHITNTLDPHEFIFLNTFLITSILLIYFICLTIYEKYNISGLYNKYTNLSRSEFLAILSLTIITIGSTLTGLSVQKNKSTASKNNLIIKSITTIIVIGVSIYIYDEDYNNFDIFGIILIICGIYMINS
jgi:multidrug transporter EmrE-like cation transporter